jgi:DNA-binding transcriptional MerR regulator
MHIGEVAERLGTTPHAIRFYERNALVPVAGRSDSGYREHSERDVSRLRLLIGLRSLDLPLDQAAEIARRADDLRYLDGRLAHLAGELESGKAPRPLITLGKEDSHAS